MWSDITLEKIKKGGKLTEAQLFRLLFDYNQRINELESREIIQKEVTPIWMVGIEKLKRWWRETVSPKCEHNFELGTVSVKICSNCGKLYPR